MEVALDVYALLIFLGVIQGVFLSVFFLTGRIENRLANVLFGLFLLAVSAIIFEILLCHSGYIVKVVHLVDFSEPFNLFIGPVFYLSLVARARHAARLPVRQYLHLAPFVLYLLYCVFFFLQSAEYKYNAYLNAYHPGAPGVPADVRFDADPLGVKSVINELTIIHLSLYSILSLWTVGRTLKQSGLSFFGCLGGEYSRLRAYALMLAAVCVILYSVKAAHARDLGDYAIATLITAIIYWTSVTVIRESKVFLDGHSSPEKYARSSLTEQALDQLEARLNALMRDEKPHLDPGLSLAGLAKRLAISPHHLSQLLNQRFHQNFFEYLASFRIEEAKRILSDPQAAQLRIDDVAESVGYYSKSAFNTAFKKITHTTPSEYRRGQIGI